MPDGIDADLYPATGDSNNAVVAKRIAYAVRALKRRYYEARNQGRLKRFVISTTNRSLTRKVDYWKFIGIGLKAPDSVPVEDPYDGLNNSGWKTYYRPNSLDEDYKGHVNNMSPEFFKDILQQFYNDELTWEEAIENFTFHPFVQKRRDHVLTMLTLIGQSNPRVGR